MLRRCLVPSKGNEGQEMLRVSGEKDTGAVSGYVIGVAEELELQMFIGDNGGTQS